MQVVLTLKKGIYINIQGWTLYLNWTDKKAQMNCIHSSMFGTAVHRLSIFPTCATLKAWFEL